MSLVALVCIENDMSPPGALEYYRSLLDPWTEHENTSKDPTQLIVLLFAWRYILYIFPSIGKPVFEFVFGTSYKRECSCQWYCNCKRSFSEWATHISERLQDPQERENQTYNLRNIATALDFAAQNLQTDAKSRLLPLDSLDKSIMEVCKLMLLYLYFVHNKDVSFSERGWGGLRLHCWLFLCWWVT